MSLTILVSWRGLIKLSNLTMPLTAREIKTLFHHQTPIFQIGILIQNHQQELSQWQELIQWEVKLVNLSMK